MDHVTKRFTFGYSIFVLTWILFLFPSNGRTIELSLQTRVFVALKGENLSVTYKLKKPQNLSEELVCFDPYNQPIYRFVVRAPPKEIQETFILTNMTISGKYSCQYKTAEAFWYLRVRDSGYTEVWNYKEIVAVSAITGLLLVFSVAGSVYVFRGTCKYCKPQNNQSDESRKDREETESVEPAQSTSLYASLDARPKSIYDVLDPIADSAAGHQDQMKAKIPKTKNSPKMVRDAPQNQDEGIFECVYENF
ncbi:unnamed protein product [Knipowitschia caucasica]